MTLSAVSHLSSIILSAKSAWLRWKTALTMSAAAAASWHLQHLSKICWKEIQCLQINVKSQAEICFVPSFDFLSLELFHSKVGQQYKMIWFYTIQNDSIQYDNIYNSDNIRHKMIQYKSIPYQMIRFKTMWYKNYTIQNDTMRNDRIQNDLIRYQTIWYKIIWCKTIQYETIFMKRMKDKSWLSKKSFPSDQSSSVAAEAAESRSSALISTNILCERKFSMKKMDDFFWKSGFWSNLQQCWTSCVKSTTTGKNFSNHFSIRIDHRIASRFQFLSTEKERKERERKEGRQRRNVEKAAEG